FGYRGIDHANGMRCVEAMDEVRSGGIQRLIRVDGGVPSLRNENTNPLARQLIINLHERGFLIAVDDVKAGTRDPTERQVVFGKGSREGYDLVHNLGRLLEYLPTCPHHMMREIPSRIVGRLVAAVLLFVNLDDLISHTLRGH